MKTVVFDMDDLYLDPANGLNWLYWLKGKYPNFKATLFTIPFRSPMDWLKEVKKIDWLELAVHGFQHDNDETFNLSADSMKAYLSEFEESGIFVKGFKGANWIVSEALIDILRERGYWVAVKEKFIDPIKQWPLTDERVVHGHIWMMETHMKEGKFDFDNDTEFKFISEVI